MNLYLIYKNIIYKYNNNLIFYIDKRYINRIKNILIIIIDNNYHIKWVLINLVI